MRTYILFFAFIIVCFPSYSQENPSRALLDANTIDFGTVHRGGKVEKTINLSNTGGGNLIIQGMKMSMPGLTVKAKQTIAPGEKSPITVELNTAAASGDVDGNVILVTNDPETPELNIHIKGHIESTIDVQPRPMILLSAFRWEASQKEGSVTIVNKGTSPLKILNLRAEGDQFTPSIRTVEDGKRYELSVKLKPTAASGKAIGKVTLETDQEILQIPVYTFMMERVYMNPGYVNFGSLDLDLINKDPDQLNYRKVSVFLYQYHGDDFQIQIKSCPEYLSIEKIPAQARGSVINIPGQGKTAVFELAISPVKERLKRGKYEDSITLTTNDKDFPVIKIPVTCEIS